MDVEEKRDRLYQIAASDPDPARRAEARARLAKLPTKSAETGRPPVNLAPRKVADDVEVAPDQKVNTLSQVNAALDAPLAGLNRMAVGAANGASMGGFGIASDLIDRLGHSGESRKLREDFSNEHPILDTAATVAGSLLPRAPVKAVGTALESGIEAGARMSPRLRSLLGIPVVGSVLKSMGIAVPISTVQSAAEHPEDMAGAAVAGAKGGAAMGAGFGVLGTAARGGAKLMRNEDIALLEKYGLEPSPLPGTPVTKQGETLSAVRNPPTGTNTASPSTRQAAGLESAGTIAGDISAREGANDAQIGRLRAENQRKYGATSPEPHVRGNPEEAPDPADGETVELKVPESMSDIVYGKAEPQRSPVRPVLDALDALKRRADLPNATRGRLDEVGQRVREISTQPTEVRQFDPNKVISADGLTAGKAVELISKSAERATGPAKAALQAEIDRITEMASTPTRLEAADPTANPNDLQGVKRLARNLGNQDKIQGVTASEGALRSVADSVNSALPPEMQAQDQAYFEARRRTELAKESVGLRRNGTIPLEEEAALASGSGGAEPGEGNMDFADPRTVESVANHLARRGEDTKAGANATSRTQRLYDEGSPEVMAGAEKPPEIDVRSQMDRPRLQLAQERLQLNPSAVFSGGNIAGAPARALKAGSRRFLYPFLKDVGNSDVAPYAAAGGDIINILRLRSKLLNEDAVDEGAQ